MHLTCSKASKSSLWLVRTFPLYICPGLTRPIGSVTSLYAFFFQPSPPYTAIDGWSLYSPREEFARMGLGTRTKAWRFTDINKDYTVRPSACHIAEEIINLDPFSYARPTQLD